jgi:hypothetical protein
MSKLMYALLGTGALVAVASLDSRFVAADTLSGSSGSSSSSGGNSSSGSGPDCSGAKASRGVIWPPDHKMVPETIVGVRYAGVLSIAVKLIQQDEPVDALGSGNTAPDGWGIGTPTAYVRAERAGPGTGRLYFISFTASGASGACSGTVPAFVPHDQGQGFTPIDTRLRYDSTVVPN